MIRGKLISIEGIEGAGKSTAVEYIKNYLQQANIDVICTREPGGTALAEEIRQILLHTQVAETITAEAELLLMYAARAQHIHQLISPALEAGKWVISDRFMDASYAYQGGGRGIDRKYIDNLNAWIVAPVFPDLTLLLDISPEQGFERAAKRSLEKDRIEKEAHHFFARVRQVYLARAKEDPKRIKVIDASQSPAVIKQQLCHLLDAFRAGA
ncbi:MAG: dTMP kinase [Gammaproteobacteria bacterium]|nr:dTMP kinase [Gammaproteobacteria bacterium]